MGIDDELLRCSLVEVLVTLRSVVEVMTVALTIFAMGRRSCRMACMSCRLYLRTGVWPVKKRCDFAHPRPKRMLRLPVWAALSWAPGSSVT